jgi:hypothetical protein
MIFFKDINSPTYRAIGKFRALSLPLADACSGDRIEIVEKFLEEYWEENEELPKQNVLEMMAAFILRPYIGNKEDEYKILSVFSLERRESNQVPYLDDLGK